MYSKYKVFAVLSALVLLYCCFLYFKQPVLSQFYVLFLHTYLQLIIVWIPRNYEDNIPVDYESELRVSNFFFYTLYCNDVPLDIV